MFRVLLPLLLLLTTFGWGPLRAQQYVVGGETAADQINPVLRADGKLLYFTRPDHPSNQGRDNKADVWQVQRFPDGSWGRAINPGSPVNSFAHDQLIGISPDGNRLAVLRQGATNVIDLLETSGRNWRITESWPLPADLVVDLGLTFDLNARQLIYGANAGAKGDLFLRQALLNGEWSVAKPLSIVNSDGEEAMPALAADGRTLYFRRNGNQWLRQSSRDQRAEVVRIPGSVKQFSPSLKGGSLIATVVDGNGSNRLQVITAETADLPLAVELYRGYLPASLPPGETTATIQLMDGQEMTVVPDALNRYALFLRNGENIAGSASAGTTEGSNAGMATTGLAPSPAADRQRIEAGIATRQRALELLDAERRKYELVAPADDDPEMAALRDQLSRINGDTIPPANSAAARREQRYAAELAELERMKAKFRKQQNGELNQGSRSNRRNLTAKSGQPAARPNTYGTPAQPTYPLTAAQRQKAYEDSLRYAAEVRNNLYRDQAPRAYERQRWENELRKDLPRTEPLSAEEAARLDAEYQRQLAELESLRARLRNLEGRSMSTPTQVDQQRWEARSPVANPSPQAYGSAGRAPVAAPQTSTPSTYGASATKSGLADASPAAAPSAYGNAPVSAPMPAGISFIPNTAYPDTRGYSGLDQLVGLVRQSTAVLEIRVHTPLELNPRAAQLLSEERATTIRNYLLAQQVSPNNFTVLGYGHNLTGEQGERVEVLRR